MAEPRLPVYEPLRLLSCFPLCPLSTPGKESLESTWEPLELTDLLPTEYEIYAGMVHLLRLRGRAAALDPGNPEVLADLDACLPLAAYMETTGCFRDEDVEAALFSLEPSRELAHTMRTMPDICHEVFNLKFWTKDCPTDWATLLTKATPLPCKGRNLEKSFAEAVSYSPHVFDFVIRVLFGCFLGLYGGRTAGFRTRLALYAAFVVHPPAVADLQRFLLANKSVIGLCVESYILFSMAQGTMDDFLRANYQWDVISDNRKGAMLALQESVDAMVEAHGYDFMLAGEAWTSVGGVLRQFSVEFKKFCFRPVTQSMTSCVVNQAFKIWRKVSGDKCYAGLLRIPSAYAQWIWSIPFTPWTQSQFDKALVSLPSAFFRESTQKAWNKIRRGYYMESSMTGPQHLMAGTEKKKNGLFFEDTDTFFDIFGFCLAAQTRSKIRWATLPKEWALNQAEALRIPGTDGISPSAGVYYICPNCATVCCVPVKFPEGVQRAKRERARYSHNTRIDFGTMELACKFYSPRRKKQIIKRRKRKQKDCDNIRVCTNTRLVPFCMIGVVLWTEQNGNLALCVDCGTMVSWTPDCYSDRGPTCGCTLQEPPPPELGNCFFCKRKFSARTKFRTHAVLNDLTGNMEHVKVCNRHGTGWVHKLPYIFTAEQIRFSIEEKKYAFLLNGTTPIFADKR